MKIEKLKMGNAEWGMGAEVGVKVYKSSEFYESYELFFVILP